MVFDDIEQWTGIYCTPQFKLNLFAWHPRTDMRWQRPIKYELNHPALYPPPPPQSPIMLSDDIRMLWSMVSKTALRDGPFDFWEGGVQIPKNYIIYRASTSSLKKISSTMQDRRFLFYKIFFLRPRLDIPIFLPIFGWKYSCNILNCSLWHFRLRACLDRSVSRFSSCLWHCTYFVLQ